MLSKTERNYLEHIKNGKYNIRNSGDKENNMDLTWEHEKVLQHRIKNKIDKIKEDIKLIRETEYSYLLKEI